MEKYLSLIILAAPGFIAERIASALGVSSSKRGEFDSLASYLSYSFFTILITVAICAVTGIIDINGNWQDFADKFLSVGFSLQLSAITLVSAIIVGLSWAIFGNELFRRTFNFVNVKIGRNKRNLDGSLLNKLFDDGKEHFIIVRKDDNAIAVGFIYSASDPSDHSTELVVTEYPEYRSEFRKTTETDEPSYLRNILQTYIDVKNNIVITETEYPPEWIH